MYYVIVCHKSAFRYSMRMQFSFYTISIYITKLFSHLLENHEYLSIYYMISPQKGQVPDPSQTIPNHSAYRQIYNMDTCFLCQLWLSPMYDQ